MTLALKHQGILVIVLILVFACTTINKKQDIDATPFKELSEDEKESNEIKSQIENLIKKLPPPSKIPGRLKESGLTFNEELLKDISKTDEYLSRDRICMVMGAYLVDASYQVSYGKMQDALIRLKKSQEMSDRINITTAFDVKLLRKFEENIQDPQELNTILDKEVKKTNQYLRSNYRTKEAVMVITGSLIESLYLTTQNTENLREENSGEILRNLTDNVFTLKHATANAANLFRLIQDDDPPVQLLLELKQLELIFDQFSGNNLESLDVNDPKFISLKKQSEKLRELI